MPEIENMSKERWWETKWAAYSEVGMSIVIGGAFSYMNMSIGIPVLIVLSCISLLSLWKAYSKQSILIPALLILLCGIGILIGQSYFNEPKQLNFATPDALISPVLKDMDIRIVDLAREDFVIRNKTFENCHFYGPAVTYLNDVWLFDVIIRVIGNNADSHFIETENSTFTGVIKFDNCIFRNCTFNYDISFIGKPDKMKRLKTIISEGGKGQV